MSSLFLLHLFLIVLSPSFSSAANSKFFAEYIGADFKGVTFSDVPINPNVDFHFILAFAIDYTTSDNPSPTNGKFNVFWDKDKLTPSAVASIKKSHKNVKFALSLGGDSVGGQPANFAPTSVETWVDNAVSSLTDIIKQYHLDGIDIDYEHFKSDDTTFVECIGKLLTKLKNNKVISFASIAPFDGVENYYSNLYNKYGNIIDYVNFQFYSYSQSTTVSQFLSYFDKQSSKYTGGKVLVSFLTENNNDESYGGLKPGKGFFKACKTLKKNGKLHGIFVYSADDTFKNKNNFKYEKQAQELLASST
ncbi:chitinase 2-like [Carex rostrata]